MPAGSRSHNAVEPSMSESRNVTVPAGSTNVSSGASAAIPVTFLPQIDGGPSVDALMVAALRILDRRPVLRAALVRDGRGRTPPPPHGHGGAAAQQRREGRADPDVAPVEVVGRLGGDRGRLRHDPP